MTAVSETTSGIDDFAARWADWHRRHEAARAGEHGFLAITSLNWLTDEPQRFADAPGEWSAGPDGVVVALADGESLTVGGTPVTGRYSFGVIAERDSVYAAWGDAVIEVAKRGGNDIVRPRHPDNPLRVAYRGTPAYPADPRWAIAGRYVPFGEPRPTAVGSVADGLEHVYAAPGRVEFSVDGRELALTAFAGHEPGGLFVLFTDETSGVTTYAANLVAAPARAGRGRQRGRRLQPGHQPAVRLHQPRHLPAAARGEPAAGRGGGGGEDPRVGPVVRLLPLRPITEI